MFSTMSKILLFIVCHFTALISIAYEIGDIEVLSAVNEPLEGRINLSGQLKEKDSPVILDVASQFDYIRHKVVRNYYAADLKFYLKYNASGDPYIRVKSNEPMMTRNVDFLLMMLTSEKRLFAKYRFILPQIKKYNSPPIIAKNSLLPLETRVLLSQKESSYNKKLVPKDSVTKKYNVIAGDSISKIAMKLAKHYPQFKSWQLLMNHLIKLNPNAFFKGNINNLKITAQLKLPNRSNWNNNSLLANSSNKQHSQKNSAPKNHKKIKPTSLEKPLVAKNNIDNIKKNNLNGKSYNKKEINPHIQKKRPLKIRLLTDNAKIKLSYNTLNNMSMQYKNSNNYQTQSITLVMK